METSEYNIQTEISNIPQIENHILSTCLPPFIRPTNSSSVEIKLDFLNLHPIQPIPLNGKSVDFHRIYNRILSNGDVMNRKWISFSIDTQYMYCSSCMAFSTTYGQETKFITGYLACIKKNKSLYQDIERHEKSKIHENSSLAVLRAIASNDIGNLINRNVFSQHAKEVKNRREILKRLIDIVLFIGTQGIPYRGKEEGAYSLVNRTQNHGNFLELVLLMSKYDKILNDHVDKSIK